MNHYRAETIPLETETFMSFKNNSYHYWNPIVDEFQSVNIARLFRTNYSDINYPQPPTTGPSMFLYVSEHF